MDTSRIKQEQISALADGELTDSQVDIALAALTQPDGRAAWETYHQIGDVLRSDEMDVSLSPNFAARMAARLAAEPTILAPIAVMTKQPQATPLAEEPDKAWFAERAIKRFAMPGMVAAAVAAIAFVATPQLMVALKGGATNTAAPVMVASAPLSSHVHGASAAATVQAEVVLRDPHIDEYLLAHQRFSPSLYSTAQYARSATFATDSDK